MKRMLFLVTVFLLVFTLVGCKAGEKAASSNKNNEGNTKVEGKTIEIAWIGKTLNNPWWISVADIAKREAEHLGVNLEISIPQEEVDLEKQVSIVEQAIQKGSDAIVISAASSDGILPALEKARNAGIKIVNFDTRISDPNLYDAYVGADDVEGAYKAGKYIAEQLGGKGKVGLITGLLAQSTGVDRKEGFLKAISEYPDIEVVAEASADWRSDLAADVTTNMLTANPDIDAIFASNDQMAVGMVNSAQAANKADDLILVGYDGILDSVNLVLKGSLDAFVALPNIDEGAMGPRIATALVLNPDYKFERELIYPTTLVTQEYVEGLTDQTIYEYAAERFPLIGVTDKGY
ncbi:sugar ABC transporter substrate-binding protein [Bacillus sp. FJAT-50079]|uniref:sugar ABC transporter substrate-binding protein n=1 Tax=Bacillus sp. FJAT-50079 TaxID=2833577 RepID=UPI001BC8F1FF|nr:sugar ABC transporter substrate-binding protein [Bacillus sp. FJAT-50079]MBS4208111.1 sugar ABC transporter substrate-binding protein [Bacillus sp. FJAT-50079]